MPGPGERRTFEEIEAQAQAQKRQEDAHLRAMTEQVMQSKDPKTHIFKAEGKYLVRSSRDSLKTMADAYHTPTDLPADDTESFAGNLDHAYRSIREAIGELKNYVSEDVPQPKDAFQWSRKESDEAFKALPKLESAYRYLDACYLHEESDDNDELRKLYSEVSTLLYVLENSMNGNLVVPTPPARVNGRKAHYIDTTVRAHQPLADYYDYVKKEYFSDADFDKSDAAYWSRKGDPLFPHDPCPEDCNQGRAGDCYFISMMAAIAEMDPQLIKDAMVDQDDKVTVRFYHGKEPVYVTVDKKIPGNLEPGFIENRYAVGPLWIQMLEKAYAASGLKNNMLKEAEQGTYFGSYGDLNSFYAMYFLGHFLGGFYDPSTREKAGLIDIPAPNNDTGLTEGEKAFVDRINEACSKGYILYAGGDFDMKEPEIQSERVPGTDNFTGLYNGHAYSVHGAVLDNGHCYVKVRNPHGKAGRVYDKQGKAVLKDDANGYNLVDVKAFGRYFKYVQYACVQGNSLIEAKHREGREYRDMYGEIVSIANKTLNRSDAFYMGYYNTEYFNEIKKACGELKTSLDYQNPNPEIVRLRFKKLFETAHAYLKHRDEQVRDVADEYGDRAVNRYQMAEMLVNLERFYNNNPEMKKITAADVTATLGESGPVDSAAKRASAEVFRRRRDAKAAKEQAAAARKQPRASSVNPVLPK